MPATTSKFLLPQFRSIPACQNSPPTKMDIFYPFFRLLDVFTAVLKFAFSFGLAVIVALILIYLVQRVVQKIRGTTAHTDGQMSIRQ